MVLKWDPISGTLSYFWRSFSMFPYISFGIVFQLMFRMFRSSLRFVWKCFGCLFESSWFEKMYTAPTPEHVFKDLAPCFLLISPWFSDICPCQCCFILNRFWKPFWLVSGSTFGAGEMGGWGQQVINILWNIDAKIGIEKSRFRGSPIGKQNPELFAGRRFPNPA